MSDKRGVKMDGEDIFGLVGCDREGENSMGKMKRGTRLRVAL